MNVSPDSLPYKPLIVILALALLIRILFFWGIFMMNSQGFFQKDSYGYWQIADNIINHSSISSSPKMPLAPEHSRTPMYPLFISLLKYFGFSAAGIVFFQLLLSVITCLLVAMLTYQLTTNRLSAYLACGLIALDIPSTAFANSILTETLFTFLLTFSVLCLVVYCKRKNFFALFVSGVLLGLSILCRPIATFLPILLVFLLINQKRSIRMAICYLVIVLLVVSPWLIRNKFVFGYTFISTIGYHNLLHYRAAGIYTVKKGINLTEAQNLLEEIVKSSGIEENTIRYKKQEAKVALKVILTHPLIYSRNHIVSVLNMLFKPLRSTIDLQLGLAEKGSTLSPWGKKDSNSLLARLRENTSLFTIVLVVMQLILLLIVWSSFFYSLVLTVMKKEYLTFCIIAWLLLYFSIVSGGPEAYARFRVPLIPYLATGAGIGLREIYQILKLKLLTNEIK